MRPPPIHRQPASQRQASRTEASCVCFSIVSFLTVTGDVPGDDLFPLPEHVVGPAVVGTGGLAHGQGENISQFLDRCTGLQGALEVFQDAGFRSSLDGQGEADELVGLLIDAPFLGIQGIHLIEHIGEFRKKLG
ncbi:hypothetical protein DESC_370199 [Desulfosarcina cetonica]|nr:hypothetical protein DESC_370199 [Desulfosarcina cetonica]